MQNEKTAYEQHQNLGKICGTSNGIIVWDLYRLNEKKYLEDKIKTLIPNEKNISVEKMNSMRNTIIEAIWNQRKYNNNNLVMSISFVIHTPEYKDPLHLIRNTKNYTIHPIFRIRKCRKEDNSKNCCMVFVDEIGRVYQDWDDYTSNNKLPDGAIIAPKKGIYDFDNGEDPIFLVNRWICALEKKTWVKTNNEMSQPRKIVDLLHKQRLGVILEYVWTPASGRDKALKITDYSMAGIGIAAAATLPITILAAPVAAILAPIAITCAVVGSIAGGWSIGRASHALSDRGYHEQSIGFDNNEARAAWIGLAAGVTGVGAIGVGTGLAACASAGRVVPIALQETVLAMNGLAIATNGISIGNNIVTIIIRAKDDEEISAFEIMELSTSLILFCHSIYNLHTAVKIMKSSESNPTVAFFRKMLGDENNYNVNNILKALSKLSNSAKVDVIKPLKKIPENKYGEDVIEIMKKIENNEMKIPDNFNLPDRCNNDDNKPLIPPNIPKIGNSIAFYVIQLVNDISMKFFVGDKGSLIDIILNIAQSNGDEILLKLLEIAEKFGKEIIEKVVRYSKILIPFENFIMEVYEGAMKYCYIGGKMLISTLVNGMRQIYDYLIDIYQSFISSSGPSTEYNCSKCNGKYKIVATN